MSWRSRAANWLREPLVHFAIAGALVFALFGEANAPDDRRIVVDQTRLAGQFAQSFRRAPTRAELNALIEDEVRDEVYYREALRLGLDRDDAVVRRRMRLKLEDLATASLDAETPGDETLQRWLDATPARYAGEPAISFDQTYKGPGVLALPAGMDRAEPDEIAAVFGEAFAAAIVRFPVDRWAPIESGFGTHLVRVRERIAPPPPRLEQIRQRVENDWRAAQARARTERAFGELRDEYQVTIAR